VNPEIGRAGIQLGCLLVVPSAVLLLFLDPASAEFIIMLITFVVGLIFLCAMILLTLRSQR
jgi:hypothetical protein